MCDRGRPCKACIHRGTTCSYEVQDGLLTRLYPTPDSSLPIGFSLIGPLEEGEPSDEECVRCRRYKLNCDGEQPCYTCVKSQHANKIANCNYRRSDGTFESWAVRPFQLESQGQPNLRENYKSFTGRRRSRMSNGLEVASDTLNQDLWGTRDMVNLKWPRIIVKVSRSVYLHTLNTFHRPFS
jgi:hypothetical protein